MCYCHVFHLHGHVAPLAGPPQPIHTPSHSRGNGGSAQWRGRESREKGGDDVVAVPPQPAPSAVDSRRPWASMGVGEALAAECPQAEPQQTGQLGGDASPTQLEVPSREQEQPGPPVAAMVSGDVRDAMCRAAYQWFFDCHRCGESADSLFAQLQVRLGEIGRNPLLLRRPQ